MTGFLRCVGIILLVACSRAQCGEIEKAFFGHQGSSTKNPLTAADLVSTNDVIEIGIEHTACYVTCPFYTFVVKSDGACRYVGERYTTLTGRLTGKVPLTEFKSVLEAIKKSGYLNLKDRYNTDVTDSPSVFTMVTVAGRYKVIENYAGAGPDKLKSIEKMIDDLISKVKWDAPPETAD